MQGLQNLGSTCAINSLIQIICRTPYLRNIILKADVSDNTITYQLKEIIDMMHNKGHSLSPKKFIGHLYRHFDGIFRQGEQLDICELWMFLYDKIASECGVSIPNVSIEPTIIPQLPDITNQTLSSCQALHQTCHATLNKINGHKESSWMQSAQGIMLNMLKCNSCHNISYNFEPFTAIQLDIPDDSENPTIASMFRNYLKIQEANGDWKCDRCNVCMPYTKLMKIWKMPPVLVFVIKRFANIHTKNTKPVYINANLNIKKSSVITYMNQDMNYVCNAFGLHFGGLSGGHYCALCKTEDKWLLYDDLNISQVQDIKTFFESNPSTYMVVYSIDNAL